MNILPRHASIKSKEGRAHLTWTPRLQLGRQATPNIILLPDGAGIAGAIAIVLSIFTDSVQNFRGSSRQGEQDLGMLEDSISRLEKQVAL